jgi:hypothetical protein
VAVSFAVLVSVTVRVGVGRRSVATVVPEARQPVMTVIFINIV